MLSIAVANADLARKLIARSECAQAGRDRAYLVYETTSADDALDVTYTDVDGEPVIACRAFGTLAEADAWVRHEIEAAG